MAECFIREQRSSRSSRRGNSAIRFSWVPTHPIGPKVIVSSRRPIQPRALKSATLRLQRIFRLLIRLQTAGYSIFWAVFQMDILSVSQLEIKQRIRGTTARDAEGISTRPSMDMNSKDCGVMG